MWWHQVPERWGHRSACSLRCPGLCAPDTGAASCLETPYCCCGSDLGCRCWTEGEGGSPGWKRGHPAPRRARQRPPMGWLPHPRPTTPLCSACSGTGDQGTLACGRSARHLFGGCQEERTADPSRLDPGAASVHMVLWLPPCVSRNAI